jgi:hypothetical protein
MVQNLVDNQRIIKQGNIKMVCSLRYALSRIFGPEKDYIHYYKSIINAYEKGLWFFDIRDLVKNISIEIPCSYTFSRKGCYKRTCLAVKNFKEFKIQFEKYLNEYLYPIQELRQNKIIYRKAWIKNFGYILKGNQYCQESLYDCLKCKNKSACDIAKKHTNNEPMMKRAIKILEILYGNLQTGYYAKQVKDFEE